MYYRYFEKLLSLLAIEYNCTPDDFKRDENVLTAAALNEGRRQYSPEQYFFHMVTTGNNAVVTSSEVMHDFLKGFIQKTPGYQLFEMPNILPLNEELKKYGYKLSQTLHMFLPCKDVEPKGNFEIKWYRDREIDIFYGDKRFPNAICSEFLPDRPDRIVVTAVDGDKIMGMAGCSEDAPHWQQIGIDIMPEYRSKGLGTYLVTTLKNEIAKQGDIPFYGTSVSNYHSWNIAINSGFRPAWVEIGAKII